MRIRIHHRDGSTVDEFHPEWTEWQVWKLTTAYNKTAFDAGVTDRWVEDTTKEQ
jgi:hypothetical protein